MESTCEVSVGLCRSPIPRKKFSQPTRTAFSESLCKTRQCEAESAWFLNPEDPSASMRDSPQLKMQDAKETQMSTNTSTPTPNTPQNPARGNQQGQTTLAAKIDRWEGMINNLQPLLDEVPQLKPAHGQLQQTVADAKVLRDQLRNLKAVIKGSTAQRKDVMATGEELFARLSLGLRSAYGPKNERLAAFSVKPRKSGQPSKVPALIPPAPEVITAPAAAPPGATSPASKE
jgi:hypothetical protein